MCCTYSVVYNVQVLLTLLYAHRWLDTSKNWRIKIQVSSLGRFATDFLPTAYATSTTFLRSALFLEFSVIKSGPWHTWQAVESFITTSIIIITIKWAADVLQLLAARLPLLQQHYTTHSIHHILRMAESALAWGLVSAFIISRRSERQVSDTLHHVITHLCRQIAHLRPFRGLVLTASQTSLVSVSISTSDWVSDLPKRHPWPSLHNQLPCAPVPKHPMRTTTTTTTITTCTFSRAIPRQRPANTDHLIH